MKSVVIAGAIKNGLFLEKAIYNPPSLILAFIKNLQFEDLFQILQKDDVNIYLLILLCGQPAVIGLATSVDPALRTASSDRSSY